jgi:hypothetical protein
MTKNLIREKKGIFFSTDALIATTLIVLAVLTLYPLLKYSNHESRSSGDLMETISKLKIGEIQNAYVASLITSGKINDLNKSILEQIGEFYVTNITEAKNLAENIFSSLDKNGNFGIWYLDDLLFLSNNSAYESASDIEVDKSVISGMQKGGNFTGFSARAFLSKTNPFSYFYLGGYVGDGNISLNISYEGQLKDIFFEIAINREFDIYINNNFSGHYSKSISEFTPARYDLSAYLNRFYNGSNIIELRGDNLYVAGGYLKFSYTGGVLYNLPRVYNFPGIKGVINLYDGVYIPQNISSMEIYLHYQTGNNTIFFNIANKTLINSTNASEQKRLISDAEIKALFNYNNFEGQTVPIRLGLPNVGLSTLASEGNADVILITDVSGSMDWRMDRDIGTSYTRACSDALINNPDTKRLSLAKCIDKEFIGKILSGTSNKVGLISFSTSADSYLNLTNNQLLLNNTIDAYAVSGSTCISCALNRAYLMLNTSSSSNRTKYIILMTDGVGNQRSTSSCFNSLGSSNASNLVVQVGESGESSSLLSFWSVLNTGVTYNLNSVYLRNSTFGFAVSDFGKILFFNGTGWNNYASPTNEDLTSVYIFNSSLAFMVSTNGKIFVWNGSSWVLQMSADFTTLNSVKIFNSTFGFAVGDSGVIYRWNGTNWSLYTDVGNTDLNGVAFKNKTFGFAVGSSGKIYQWNGTTWTQHQDLGNNVLTSVVFFNSSLAFATDSSGEIYSWKGTTWTQVYSSSYPLTNLVVVNSTLVYAFGDSNGGVIFGNGNTWNNFFPNYLFEGRSTTGLTCNDDDSCSLNNNIPGMNSNWSSCRTHNDLNVTIHSVGFGPVSTCNIAINTLQAVAKCGNGSYYASSNSTLLINFYQEIAKSILNLSYYEQISNVSGGLFTILYPDSYIKTNALEKTIGYGSVTTFESQFSSDYGGIFYLPPNLGILDSRVISYSGPRWTSVLFLNNNTAYNLSSFGLEYSRLGDPYSINFKNQFLNIGDNVLNITTGISASNFTSGSSSNKIIVTLLSNISSFSPLSSRAEGCSWFVEFRDGSNLTIKSPMNYSGFNTCSYSSLNKNYDSNDALQKAVYQLFSSLDYNSDGRIDAEFTQQDLQVSSVTIKGIPYTWSTPVQIRRWF